MPSVELPGVDLWFHDTGGDGTPVVFLHAASGTGESWQYQVPEFTGAGYRCVAYDRRNWGRSRPNQTVEQPGYANDDLEGLRVLLGLERFHLVATAAGGIVGLDYALEHAERVLSLVVACSIGGVQDPEYLEVQHRLRPPRIQALPIELRELGPAFRGTNPEGVKRWIEIERSSRPGVPPTMPQMPREPITYRRLETVRAPVLMLAGDADILSPPALMRMLAAHINGCEFVTVAEAGHAAFWEQPEAWNRLALDFIGRHR